MNLTIRVLGLELLSLDWSTDAPDDIARDLSGGNTTASSADPGPTDLYLGFTNGRE